jgi:hypothetical protein
VKRGWVELSYNSALSAWSLRSISTMQLVEASATQSGFVTTSTQTFAGNKTFDGTLKSNTRFTKYKSEASTITGTAQTSTVDIGTLSANLSSIDIPRTGIYRIFVQCGGTGTTTLNNGIRVILHIRKSASLGTFAAGSQIGTRGFNQSENGGAGSTNRAYAMCSTEFIGSLTANDRIYFALDFYDNPNNAGTLGGGTLESGIFIVEELTASAMS